MMEVVYVCDKPNKQKLNEIVESNPYEDDSFARVGYKIKDGEAIGEDPTKVYLYISASEDFFKKADEKLKEVATRADDETANRIIDKIHKEEENAQGGFGSIFGE